MKEKIRVLFCITAVFSGGVEQRRLLLAKYFNNKDYALKLICTRSGGKVAEELNRLGVEIIEVGPFTHPFHFKKHRKVHQVIRSFKPHIIHGATFEGMSMAAMAGIFGTVPVVLLEETSDPQNRSKKANLLLNFFSRFCDRVIAISPNVKNYLLHTTKITSKKVQLITNGIDIPEETDHTFYIKEKERLGIKQEDLVIGFIGRLFNDHKRLSDLIEAFARIKKTNLKLLVVGDGVDRDTMKSMVSQLNMSEQVIFAGYQGDTAPFYQMMDIFCIPSAREGFGLVAAEAMLHRLPIIATKVGGLQDIVVDGETGFLVPPFSPELIAEKLEFLIQDAELRKAMGEQGYERAIKHYSAERYVQEVEALYLELLKEKGLA